MILSFGHDVTIANFMALVYDMGVFDLPPMNDPKGGSPKTPSGGVPRRSFPKSLPVYQQDDKGNGVHNVWKTIALLLLTANVSGIGSWLIFGTDTVRKHDLEQMDFVKHSQLSERISRLNKEDTDISRWNNEQNQKKFDELYRRVEQLEKKHGE